MADKEKVSASWNLTLPKTSRFQKSSLYLDLGPSFGRFPYNKYSFSPDKDDTFHKVSAGQEYRLDLIALEKYQSPLLWWVIALANEIQNPIMEPEAGRMLRVPSFIKVYSIISGAF